jgi:integrase
MITAKRAKRPPGKSVRLTPLFVENAKAKGEPVEIRDAIQPGLRLFVSPTGAKSWRIRFRFNGKPQSPIVLPRGTDLKKAREVARDTMNMIADGKHPRAERKAALIKDENTLAAVCSRYMAIGGGNQLRTAHERQKIIDGVILPRLGHRPIMEIERDEIVALLDHVAENSGGPMSDMVLAILRRILNWHETRTSRYRSPIVRGMARVKAADRKRQHLISDDELRRIWAASFDPRLAVFGACVRFLILTGCRRTEASNLRRSEIDAKGIWTLPASRSKNKQPITRPLSPAALELVNDMPVIGDLADPFVFTNTGTTGVTMNNAPRKRMLDEISGTSGWRLHDLRRVARSLLARCGVPRDVCERCLGHAPPNLDQIYDRHDYAAQMAGAFDKLAAEVERIVSGEREGKVIPIRLR